MGDRAMGANGVGGGGGGGGRRFLSQCENCIIVGAPNDPVGFFSTWFLPCWQFDNSFCMCPMHWF